MIHLLHNNSKISKVFRIQKNHIKTNNYLNPQIKMPNLLIKMLKIL